MKAILEFNLPDDADQHNLALNGVKYWSALWDFKETFRSIRKHCEPKTIDEALSLVEQAWSEATAGIDWGEIS